MARDPEIVLKELAEATRNRNLPAVRKLSAELNRSVENSPACDPGLFVTQLTEAVDCFDRLRVGKLCDGFVNGLGEKAGPCRLSEATKVLGILRRKRYFDEMVRVAEALMEDGQDAPGVRRQYAQALLEQGRMAAALAILQSIVSDCEETSSPAKKAERVEALGLIGRAFKQAYVNRAGSRGGKKVSANHLRKAIQSYAGPYLEDGKRFWHGINTVALLCRAKRDGVQITDAPVSVVDTAKDILAKIERRKNPTIWDLGTAAEACLALENYGASLEWIVRYTANTGADAFEFASTLRQFEEVWNLRDQNEEQSRILNLLRSAVLEREGGKITLSNPSEEILAAESLGGDSNYEAVLGKDRYKNYKLMLKGLKQARIVARIEKRDGGGHGTGFLFPGKLLPGNVASEWVLITNAHVVSEEEEEQSGSPAALPPEDVLVRFEAWENGEEAYELGRILYTSPRSKLDFSVVTIRPEIEFEHDYHLPKRLPRADGSQRVYIIGHPRGNSLSVSLHDNRLLDHESPHIHYRAPTEGGSSGSPVFNSSWDLIGLHHAGGMEMRQLNGKEGLYPANEGIWIHSVLEAIAAAS